MSSNVWIIYELSRGAHCWYSIGGRLLGVGRRNRRYIRNFSLLPFWVPIAPTVLRVWETDLSQDWCGDRPVIDPWQVCFGFPIKRQFSKIWRSKDDWGRCLGQIFFGISPCKKGARWLECLWIFYEFSLGHQCWYSIGGRLLGRFSSISLVVKKEENSTAAKYIGLPGQPMLHQEA